MVSVGEALSSPHASARGICRVLAIFLVPTS